MYPYIASFIFTMGILGLFYLDRDKTVRMSKALWIPAVWLFLISSRPASLWLGMSPNLKGVDATDGLCGRKPYRQECVHLFGIGRASGAGRKT